MSLSVTVYGDFSCPWSYLASQRVSRLQECGLAEVEWRAVEHDPRRPVAGRLTGPDLPTHKHELAVVSALRLPGEHLPTDVPAVLPNTRAAVSAYAESSEDGIQDVLRKRLFDAVWREGRPISSPYEVRRLVTDLLWPAPDRDAMRATDLPQPVDRDPDMSRVTRRTGGTVSCDGQPLTTTAWRQLTAWRGAWLELPTPAVPAVVTATGEALTEGEALEWLARLVGKCPTEATLPTGAVAPTGSCRAEPVATASSQGVGSARMTAVA